MPYFRTTLFSFVQFHIFLAALFLMTMLSGSAFAQMKPGFAPDEARDLVALCNSFGFLEMYDSDADIIPVGYQRVFSSGVFGMDNMYQVYIKGQTGVINFRGSTDDQKSWLANFTSAMIPAQGEMMLRDRVFAYHMSEDTTAAIHSGYAVGLGFLQESLLGQVQALNARGIYDIYITGHSQGGALAILTMAYLHGLPEATLSSQNRFKTYAFANPMVGNKSFSIDYNRRFADTGWSFSVVNLADPVPKLPVSYMEEKALSRQGISSLLGAEEGFDTGELLKSAFLQTFERKATQYLQSFSSHANQRIAKDLGEVILPPYVDDINYYVTGVRKELYPFEYPKILRDSTILENDSLMAVLPRDKQGYFVDESLYQKSPTFYQHKPHNYYVAVLKAYFPEDYQTLSVKCLPENL
ncbi:hypothetical protein BFP72_09395 [Reichenbachiella sp. 5M10]|nr:hypothetical protein BFP72_09395 [Reichenbachiella sp. 5M10]